LLKNFNQTNKRH